jgi:hypothetical protein
MKHFKKIVIVAVLAVVTATGAWGGCGSDGKHQTPPTVIPHR